MLCKEQHDECRDCAKPDAAECQGESRQPNHGDYPGEPSAGVRWRCSLAKGHDEHQGAQRDQRRCERNGHKAVARVERAAGWCSDRQCGVQGGAGPRASPQLSAAVIMKLSATPSSTRPSNRIATEAPGSWTNPSDRK